MLRQPDGCLYFPNTAGQMGILHQHTGIASFAFGSSMTCLDCLGFLWIWLKIKTNKLEEGKGEYGVKDYFDDKPFAQLWDQRKQELQYIFPYNTISHRSVEQYHYNHSFDAYISLFSYVAKFKKLQNTINFVNKIVKQFTKLSSRTWYFTPKKDSCV